MRVIISAVKAWIGIVLVLFIPWNISCLGGGLEDTLSSGMQPYGLVAEAGNHEVELRWNIGSPEAIQHVYYTIDGSDATIDSPYKLQNIQSPYTQTNLENGVLYKYIVVAVNGLWYSEPSNQAEAMPLPPDPDPPVNVRCIPGSQRIRISWDGVNGADYYKLYWSDTQDNPTITSPLPFSNIISNRYVVDELGTGEDLINGKSYKFMLTSMNMSGESSPSSVVECTPQKFEYLQNAYWFSRVNEEEYYIYSFSDPILLEAYYKETEEETGNDTRFRLTLFEYFVDEELRVIVEDVIANYTKDGNDGLTDDGSYTTTIDGMETRELEFIFGGEYLYFLDPPLTLRNVAYGEDNYLRFHIIGDWQPLGTAAQLQGYTMNYNFMVGTLELDKTSPPPSSSSFDISFNIGNTNFNFFPSVMTYPNESLWDDIWTYHPASHSTSIFIFALFPIDGKDYLICTPYKYHSTTITTARGLWIFE